ncbi:MAG: hypothetical protein ABSH50_09755 [Bryobacteraceae bacterium]|jgi:hypothetical protein
MVSWQIDFDEDTDRILAELALQYQDDIGKALADLVHAHVGLEAYVESCEGGQQYALRTQAQRSEREFREGRFITWDDLKRRNGL